MDDLVKRARDLLDGTTPGPWHVVEARFVNADDGTDQPWCVATADEHCGPGDATPKNASFIAATRELVPQMADRIERLEAALREATEIVHKSYVSATLDAVNAGPSHPLQGNYDKWRVRCMNAEAACRAALEGK